MPELPEVERAVRALRPLILGRVIEAIVLLHPAVGRTMSPARLRLLKGDRVRAVHRRGKHQLFALESGRTLYVHFRMSGWWVVMDRGGPTPRHARAIISFRGGPQLAFEDPRALGVLALYDKDVPLPLRLGAEPFDRALTARRFHEILRARRRAVKPTLLNQRVIAGLGNIYAAEALWRARISPFADAGALSASRAARLLTSIRGVLRRASDPRSREGEQRFAVYDREGNACRRCGTAIRRAIQAARSTYYCPRCQSR